MPGLKQTDESPPGLVTVMSSETDILKAELPARWSSKQRLKNTLIYHVVRALFALLEWFPNSSGFQIAMVKIAIWGSLGGLWGVPGGSPGGPF